MPTKVNVIYLLIQHIDMAYNTNTTVLNTNYNLKILAYTIVVKQFIVFRMYNLYKCT